MYPPCCGVSVVITKCVNSYCCVYVVQHVKNYYDKMTYFTLSRNAICRQNVKITFFRIVLCRYDDLHLFDKMLISFCR